MSLRTGEVHEIQTEEEWKSNVVNKTSSLSKVVVFFSAVWCPPCRMIKSDFIDIADTNKTGDIIFLEVDIDKFRSISNACQVHSIPTFICFCEGEVVEEIVGRDKSKLIEAVKRLLELPSTENSSQTPRAKATKTISVKKALKKLLHFT